MRWVLGSSVAQQARGVVVVVVIVASLLLGDGAEVVPWAVLILVLDRVIEGLRTSAWSAGLPVGRAGTADHPTSPEPPMPLRSRQTLTTALDGGFDTAAAELLLDAFEAGVDSDHRAVLVGGGAEPATPLALRGTDRVPWSDPRADDGLLGRVWSSGEPETGQWARGPDALALLAVPLYDPDGGHFGMLVADRPGSAPFSDSEMAAATAATELHSANMGVALIFAALRSRTGVQERERLAQELHDGVAQELAAFGFRIDLARRVADREQSEVAAPLRETRADLSRLVADLRLRIGDLRMTIGPDHGLGAALGSRLQRFATSSELAVQLHLEDSGFRLPAQVENLIYRFVLDVLSDARHSGDATTIDVTLDLCAPGARLDITHDGTTGLVTGRFADHPLTRLGGQITVERPTKGGVAVRMELGLCGAGAPPTPSPSRTGVCS